MQPRASRPLHGSLFVKVLRFGKQEPNWHCWRLRPSPPNVESREGHKNRAHHRRSPSWKLDALFAPAVAEETKISSDKLQQQKKSCVVSKSSTHHRRRLPLSGAAFRPAGRRGADVAAERSATRHPCLNSICNGLTFFLQIVTERVEGSPDAEGKVIPALTR